MNQFGLDADYFRRKLKHILNRLDNYTPDELARELGRMAYTASADAVIEDLSIKPDLKWKEAQCTQK